ncbi:hypothetical protein MLD38_007277 [Melastoma candidum]|uniref:Uncharacterized protein n=1 Tax=Melastoma candidum TaxID=119954 RepID=A0ACB9RQR0_9MYRT|nr:hypothetical protein MLD38_007277 [Melastoma candidum]
MGSIFSKKKDGGGSEAAPAILPADIDFSDLEAASRVVDPGMQVFSQTVRRSTETVIRSLAVEAEPRPTRALPFEALGTVARSTLEVEQAVVRVILDSRDDIWNSKELLSLVNDYFENSLRTFNFYTELKKCIGRAKEGRSRILLAVSYFEEESRIEGSGFERTLRQLECFKEAGDPFTEEFSVLLRSVYEQQQQMFKSLKACKDKVDRSLRSSKTWMKVTNAIFVAAFVSTLIVSVVAVAMTAPAVVTALAAGLAAPIGSLGKWCNTLWKNYRSALKQQKELLTLATGFTRLTIADIETIKTLVDKLKIEVESLMSTADLADGGETVRLTIEEIRKRLDIFTDIVEKLSDYADQGSQYTQKARGIILQRITGQPSN